MKEIKLKIDGKNVTGYQNQTILCIARNNGIDIPTLCHDERVQVYGSCGLCTVEAEGIPKLLRSCSTVAADGMVVRTNTSRVLENRKSALELLLSDHTGDCRPPCSLACPAQTDCQEYVGLVANGNYKEALISVLDKVPLPSSIGRVCPRPCEEACRRELVEEPVSVAGLKQFLGDMELDTRVAEEVFTCTEAGTGKSAAIIGGGPGGLAAAYFLSKRGHKTIIYEAMPEMGGMLRYGIPEYRLPKKILQQEISRIERTGVIFKNNVKVGKDITLDELREQNDAVIIACGAWSSVGMRIPGENLEGIYGGIDLLQDTAQNIPVEIGKKVAVVGGGNTAMDVCRTAVRLGAGEVYNIYRRTRNEMPAAENEIDEAEEEGVIFKNLTNPIEFIGENKKLKAVRLQIMELGEPDTSGRRSPVPVEGKQEIIEVDSFIIAIGQKPDLKGFETLKTTKWGTIDADSDTFLTNLDGVYAIGDAMGSGADIAVSAI
ncbi:MAG: FAD-dependent oxidoreductase, partial [Oscillospiraceae bacterium]|nr:FAD-dependent oxidoreductase [Oscillospiraceae bacterium]